jgi:hypothetical protein
LFDEELTREKLEELTRDDEFVGCDDENELGLLSSSGIDGKSYEGLEEFPCEKVEEF